MGKAFVTIGNFSIDNVVTAEGHVRLRKIGGNAIYSAIGANYWSENVGIATTIPLNYPDEWLQQLRSAGIDLAGVKRVPPAIELEEWFFYQPDGSRIDRLFARHAEFAHLNGSPLPLSPEAVAQMIHSMQQRDSEGVSLAAFRRQNPLSPDVIPAVYEPVQACHVAPNDFEIHLDMVKHLKKQKTFVSLDPAPYSDHLSPGKLEELLSHVDVFLPSEKELKLIFPACSMEEAIMRLAGMVSVVVVKLGGKGVAVGLGSGRACQYFPAYPSKVADLNGAGDSFCGGFMVGMQETGDPMLAVQYGIVSASLNIEAFTLQEKLGVSRDSARQRLESYQKWIERASQGAD